MKRAVLISSLWAVFQLLSCSSPREDVNVTFRFPELDSSSYTGSFPEGMAFYLMLSCTGEDMEPIKEEFPVDWTETTQGYEYTLKVPTGNARHFSGLLYATGPDPALHPRTYFMAGDAGLVDIVEPKHTVELDMLYILQSGYTNIYIDSQDRVWFSISPLYQQSQQITTGGIGVFDGVQWYFVPIEPFLAERGLDFSQEDFYFFSIDGNDNNIWLGTSRGVFVFSTVERQFTDFYDVETTQKIPFSDPMSDYTAQVMVKRYQEGAGSQVWFLMDGGIVVHNFTSGSFSVLQGSIGKFYNFIAEDPNSSTVYAGNWYNTLSSFVWNQASLNWDPGQTYLTDSEVLALYFDNDNKKWLSAFDNSRLKEYLFHTDDFATGSFFYLQGANGLNLNGINYQAYPFNVSDINGYENLLYFGADPGLIIFDKLTGVWSLLEPINSYLPFGYDRGIKIDSAGNVWFTDYIFPAVLPAGVKTGGKETKHPESNRAMDAISITDRAMYIPNGIAISRDGNRIYTGWQEYPGVNGWIAEIDTTSKSVNQILLNTTALPYYVRLSPDGSKLYASDSPNNRLWVVDLAIKSPQSYSLSFGPFLFEVSADGTKGYFLNDTVSPYSIRILDLVSNPGQQIDEIQIPAASGVNDMVITSDETTAYVSDWNNYKIYKVDLVNRTVTEFLDLRTPTFMPERLLLDEKNNRLIASGQYVDAYKLVNVPISDPLNYYLAETYLPDRVFDMLLTQDSSVLFLTFSSIYYFYVIDARNIGIIRAESPFTEPAFYGGPMVTSPDGKTVFVVTKGPFGAGYPLNLEIIR